MFTSKEAKLLAQMIENFPLQGTLLTLPGALEEIFVIRKKLQTIIDATETTLVQKETPPNESKSPD